MLSADATEGQVRQLLAMGAEQYLTKPVDLQRLLEAIDTQLACQRKVKQST